jgi:ATP-dependent Clp protease ATP-binding subunit ClpX
VSAHHRPGEAPTLSTRRGTPPEVIRERLDQLVTGQDEAKEALFLAALRRGEFSGPGQHGPILLIGPTRSSRVYLARALAHALEAPFAEGDEQALVRFGTEPVEPLLHQLLLASDFDVEVAQRGVVYVDGTDHRGAQERLLQLWDETSSGTGGRHLKFDLARVLFICGGVFVGLDGVAARLGRHPEQLVIGEMLAELGVAPELVRRFRAIARVVPLDEEALVRLVLAVDYGRMTGQHADL